VAHRIGIVGASGYGGGELLRLLADHPAIDVEVVAAHSQAGTPVAQLFPNLAGERTFDAVDLDQLVDLDLVFLSTPHGPALELGAALHDAGTKVVDLSAAFRLSGDGFATWYHEDHPRPDLAAGDPARKASVAYGLPELHRDAIRGARLVAWLRRRGTGVDHDRTGRGAGRRRTAAGRRLAASDHLRGRCPSDDLDGRRDLR
jgi:N-acetyl-gamma-glutamyl-phosphate reductase